MSKKTEPSAFDRVREMFREVGATDEDLEWAENATTELAGKDTKEPYIAAIMGVAAQTLNETGESALATFGASEDWAHQRVKWLKAEGFDAFEFTAGLPSLKVTVENTFWLAVWFSVLLGLHALLNLLPGRQQWDFIPVVAVLPLLLAACCSVVYSAYAVTRPRMRFPKSLLVSALSAFAAAALSAAIILALKEVGPHWPWPYLFLLVPFYCVVALGTGKLPSKKTEPPAPMEQLLTSPGTSSGQVETTAWTARLREVLRLRNDMTDEAIDSSLQEIQDHLNETRSSPESEFGSPEGYANTFPGDQAVAARRKLLLYAILGSLWMIVLLGAFIDHGVELSWQTGTYGLLVLIAGTGVLSEAKAWRAARRPRPQAG